MTIGVEQEAADKDHEAPQVILVQATNLGYELSRKRHRGPLRR